MDNEAPVSPDKMLIMMYKTVCVHNSIINTCIVRLEQWCQTELIPTKQEHTWFGSGVFLLGWNENLQPHGPLLDQFDTTGLEEAL